MESNGQGWVRMLCIKCGTMCVRACLNGCGSVMLVIVSGSEFQYVIVWGKKENL